MANDTYFIGVDVGTGSVRAALVSDAGKLVKTAVKNIETWNSQPNFYEQSSENIWKCCVDCIKEVTGGIQKESIRGIGFDATCSLVALDKNGNPLSVSPTGNQEQNIILWMDHRASKEAEEINNINHSVLRYVGGKISLEMETPKLLWLKRNMKEECWDKAGLFFDLPDFLTWKATGSETRSLCSLVCKWTYEIGSNELTKGWNKCYFSSIGLADLLEDNFQKIGNVVLPPGTPVGKGLSQQAAEEMSLLPGTAVGTSIIDAHAGGLGLVGCSVEGIKEDFNSRLSLICGTSTCHMAVSTNPIFTPGVWGPYFSAMVPGMWLNEGGQSATGKLVDHIIDTHPASQSVKEKLGEKHIQEYLSNFLSELAKRENMPCVDHLTSALHMWPDFHGNRSPIADSTLKGMICGLTLQCDEENLALMYLATIQALAYGTRHILETLIESGYSDFHTILICGGLSKNPLFVQTQADTVGLPVICPEESESVLLGSSILGACAAGYFEDMNIAIKSMGGKGRVVNPRPCIKEYHDKKYKVYLKMLEDQRSYRKLME